MILLYSFEGTTFRYSDNNDGDTPISMPNIEVKPIGAESTWLEAAWKDRTLLNKETHHRDVMSFFSVLSFQAARSYIEMNRLVIFMSQVLSMYGSTSAGMDIGVARMPMTTL